MVPDEAEPDDDTEVLDRADDGKNAGQDVYEIESDDQGDPGSEAMSQCVHDMPPRPGCHNRFLVAKHNRVWPN